MTAAGLVEVARVQGATFSARVSVRRRLVLDHAEALHVLADRPKELEPVDVATRRGSCC